MILRLIRIGGTWTAVHADGTTRSGSLREVVG
jgi:hypothetical protein